ncbi:Domain of unknown function DUF1737 [uncultured Caudovirales phage]|uniref:Uncharacterized protein n=1 Tax=uncultured Caudovirales phage TaxID=2100421 RepID=A0A6J5NUD9_9CAUD|nr:Domain of unknown function DUF1737 [uncultured Caudovirales phage]
MINLCGMKYKIVETRDAEILENEVNHLIDQGYKPLGGMRVIVSPYSSLRFYQTLVLENNHG